MQQHLVDYLKKLLYGDSLPQNSRNYFLTVQNLIDQGLVIRNNGKLEITPAGKSALKEHEEALQEKQQQFNLNTAALRWSKIAGITAIVTGILGLLSFALSLITLLLTVLQPI